MDNLSILSFGDFAPPAQLEKELTDFIHALSQVRDTQQVMEIVRQGARDMVGADGVTFVLRDNGYCYYAEENAISPLWKGMRFPMESCISGWAMTHQQTVVIEDIYLDPRIPYDIYRLTFVRSMVMVPVRRDDPIAAIGAYWKEKRLPTDDEVKLLETIANAAAVALTNVGLVHSLHQTLEQLQQRNRELDLAYRSKANFLANMSPELRTPLNVIIGFADTIHQQILGPVENNTYISYAGDIRNAGQHLLQVINDVLDLAALGSGEYALRMDTINLTKTINTVVNLVDAQIEREGLTLKNQVPKHLPSVKGDPRLLKQIFVNILSNAIKFTPKGGIITITAEKAEKGVLCSITDSGIGMTEEEIELSMRPFQQAEDGLDRRFEGIGLGLALCKGYVDLHGGAMKIVSAKDKGTTITVLLPLA